MRSALALATLAVTALTLVATSRAPATCQTAMINLSAQTTCGPQANLSVTSTTACGVTAGGAAFGNLPLSGRIDAVADDAGFDTGFLLTDLDGGAVRTCTATPSDAGFDLTCTECPFDGGACTELCTGTLTPQ